MKKTLFVALLIPFMAGTAASQVGPQRADSLEQEIRALRARIDSLESVVRRLAGQGADTTRPADELAALRAAARAAAERPDTQSVQQPTFVDRTRSLNLLNPEISATADARIHAAREAPTQDNFFVREVEISFQSALDPYSNTKIFVALEDGEVDVEEAYAYWTALPGQLRLDIGRFRQQVGELNRWHPHALPESDAPLVLEEFLGEEGLVANGLGLYWVVPAGGGALGTHELWGQVTLADNEVLFDGGNRLSVLGHLNNFWQVSRSTFFQVGATGVYGENRDADLKTRLLGVSARLTWRPPARALYRSFTLRGEGYQVRRTEVGTPETRYGAFGSALLQVGRRWHVGGRYDHVELTPDTHQWAATAHLTWWQSEWVYLRASWKRNAVPVPTGLVDRSDRFGLQVVWAIGPHKHETY